MTLINPQCLQEQPVDCAVQRLPVMCIYAPTASGKTQLACQLYDKGGFEIVSVDSALVYQDMDIGTAKPTKSELERYPHHLVDIISPVDSYSVADFVQDATKTIENIHHRGNIPILVGGTMLYFSALWFGLSDLPATDSLIRAQVQQQRDTLGIEALHSILQSIDPVTATRLPPQDTQRITRALEVYYQTGKPLSAFQQNHVKTLNPKYAWQCVSILPDRAWLHERIAKRLEIMWAQGLVAEVLALMDRYPLQADMPSMRCVGYRQVWEYLNQITPILSARQTHMVKMNPNHTKQLSRFTIYPRQRMHDKALYATRQLAKRQYTWIKKLNHQIGNQLKIDKRQLSELRQFDTTLKHSQLHHLYQFDCIDSATRSILALD